MRFEHRLRCGRLHRIHRGVYAVGHRKLTRRGRWMAAVLAGGRGAALSHRSAAELWSLLPPRAHRPDVTVPCSRRRAASVGVEWRSSRLPPDEVTDIDGIAVTSVSRTVLDLAAVADRRTVERAMNEAEIHGLSEPLGLPTLIARHPRRRGAATVRAILAAGHIGATRTRSELEERFLRFVDRRGLPRPEMNVPIAVAAGHLEADCVWRREGLVAELDGRAVHMTRAGFESDRARDRALSAQGWRPIRITWHQIDDEPDELAADLRALLDRGPVRPQGHG